MLIFVVLNWSFTMKTSIAILFHLLISATILAQDKPIPISFDFYGNPVQLQLDKSCISSFQAPLSETTLLSFQKKVATDKAVPFIQTLLSYKEQFKLDDWLYYQLIRKTAQFISPKAENYFRYTLYKWLMLSASGYDATLKTNGEKLLFYVHTNENIYNIPSYLKNGKQYVCLNYHDYGSNIDFESERFEEVLVPSNETAKAFSYKITQLPVFKADDYEDKDLQFKYRETDFRFKVKLNSQVKNIFANYPVVDYESYFNIPLSKETYSSLMPLLKKNVKGLNIKNGVDYLMRFTRYAFLFEPDSEVFGNEKRLSPEQTLLYDQSDCEDRAALFFYLVKEIYNIPMIVLAYPEHVTIAVKFAKSVGKPIIYNGLKYSVCEPTPQKEDLAVGQLSSTLYKQPYEVVYAYTPSR